MQARRWAMLAALVAAIACDVILFGDADPIRAIASAASDIQRARQPDASVIAGASDTQATGMHTTRFAASLRGTARDGQLRVDDNGDLIVERGIRDLFDYYLTTLGEHDEDGIRRQLLAVIDAELPAKAAVQAARLLDAYLQYRELSGELQQQYDALDENNAFTVVADYFAQRDALRHELFPPDAVDAFFAADQAGERDALPRLQQLVDGTTGDDTTITVASEEHDSYARYRAAMRAGAESAATAVDHDALRMQLFGREAADRLAALDQRRHDWNTRLASYREQKRQLLTAALPAGVDPSAQLLQLQQAQFSEREILRVRALDGLEQHVR